MAQHSLPEGLIALLKGVLILVGIIFLYYTMIIAILGTDKYRLDGACRVTGFLGKYENFLLGSRFWRDQATLINKQAASLELIPKELEAAQKSAIQAQASVAEAMSNIYAQNPDLRPTPAQQAASSLRGRADAIERAESLRLFEQNRIQQLQELSRCLAIASANAR